VMGRATQGVRLINLKGNETIAAVTSVPHEEEVIVEGQVPNVDGQPTNGTDTNVSGENTNNAADIGGEPIGEN